MKWVKWDSIDAFDLWHDQIKNTLGLPKQSIDSSGALIDSAITTDSYIIPYVLNVSDIRAFVDIEHGEGLTESENPFPSRYE